MSALVPKPSPVPKCIAILVDVFGGMISKIDSKYSDVSQAMQFLWLANTVVISVNPKAKMIIHRIVGINLAVTITPVHRVIENPQGKVSIRLAAHRLRRQVAE